jgi:soluble lytic murein transglycosylase-like protein
MSATARKEFALNFKIGSGRAFQACSRTLRRARCPRSRRRVSLVTRLAGLTISLILFLCCATAFADRLHLIDGTTIEADEAWDDPQGVWYRQGGVTYLVEHARVKSIERADATKVTKLPSGAKVVGVSFNPNDAATTNATTGDATLKSVAVVQQPVTIYLTDGASFEVDEVTETDEGAWYKRGSLSIFIARARIARIEREKPLAVEGDATKIAARRERHWATGSSRLDELIRQNGARHGVDPYLIFLVMEQESHFNSRALSPTGARGLMQLMPGTAARFGVRNPNDPAQSVAGGTRYLKQLLGKFNNRVDLVLASYNAGEGSVVRFGYRVPPYRETRSYVRRISSRYGSLAHAAPDEKRATSTTRQPE